MKSIIQSIIRQLTGNHSTHAVNANGKAGECNYKNDYYGDQLCKVK